MRLGLTVQRLIKAEVGARVPLPPFLHFFANPLIKSDAGSAG
jgi:hypothetical protein